jgi:3-mercaptopropionate dioxygenase
MSSTTTSSVALERLIGSIRTIVQAESDPARVGEAVAVVLEPALGDTTLLTDDQLVPDPNHYRQHILHVEPDGSFSIVALVWLPGQETPIHDHVCWCVVGVHLGEEHETTYALAGGDDDPHLIVSGQPVNLTGTVAALVPPGDIHKVANAGDALAVSLHIYGADIGVLGTSIRRRYDLPVLE